MKPSLFGKGQFEERFARFGMNIFVGMNWRKNMIEKDNL